MECAPPLTGDNLVSPLSLTCPGGFACTTANLDAYTLPVYGCCPIGSTTVPCTLPTTCIQLVANSPFTAGLAPRHPSQLDVDAHTSRHLLRRRGAQEVADATSLESVNPYITTCTDTRSPYCATVFITSGTSALGRSRFCANVPDFSEDATQALVVRPDLPTSVSTTAVLSTASSPSSNGTASTFAQQPSLTSGEIGGIVAGVVVFLLILGSTGTIYKIRKYRTKRDREKQAAKDLAAKRREDEQTAKDLARTWFSKLEFVHELFDRDPKDDYKKIKIAVLDSGYSGPVDLTSAQICDKYDCVNPGGDCADNTGHGTDITSLIIKVYPRAQIYIAKVMNSSKGNDSTPNAVAEAIKHAIEEWKVEIITMSFGFRETEPVLVDTLKVYADKVLIFAAVSNEGANAGSQRIAFPARRSSYVIGVGSARGSGKKSELAPDYEDGKERNFSALGEGIEMTWPKTFSEAEGNGKILNGSSYATPIAAAIAALVLDFADRQEHAAKRNRIEKSHLLKNRKEMRAVLSAMSSVCDGYYFLTPWELLSDTMSKKYQNSGDIAREITKILRGL